MEHPNQTTIHCMHEKARRLYHSIHIITQNRFSFFFRLPDANTLFFGPFGIPQLVLAGSHAPGLTINVGSFSILSSSGRGRGGDGAGEYTVPGLSGVVCLVRGGQGPSAAESLRLRIRHRNLSRKIRVPSQLIEGLAFGLRYVRERVADERRLGPGGEKGLDPIRQKA